jgi:hypothetical protein
MEPGRPPDDRGATYEIRLAGAPPESLRRRFPSMRVQAMRAQTVLFRRSAGPRDLDTLLDQQRSLGLPLTEIHQAPALPVEDPADASGSRDATAARSYEVRVDGELGDKLLRYLRWSSCVVADQKSARLEATPTELQRFLSACSHHGVGIERVHRLYAAPTAGQAATGTSRDRARDRDVLRRPGG